MYFCICVKKKYMWIHMLHLNEVIVKVSKAIFSKAIFFLFWKDIVSENPHFDIDNFILLLRDRIYTKDAFARQFLVSWVSFTIIMIIRFNYTYWRFISISSDFLSGFCSRHPHAWTCARIHWRAILYSRRPAQGDPENVSLEL